MKKMCFVIPSLNVGGMERVMAELINYFVKDKELEIHLILYGIKRKIFYTIPETVIIHKPLFVFNNKYRFYNTIKTLIFLRKTIKNIKPDSILSFGEYWNSFVLLANTGLNYPIYISDRCQPNKSLGIIHDLLRKLLYRKAKGIIAQTEIAKQIYFNNYKHSNICVIGNPIRDIKGENENIRENIVLTVSRLIKTKNIDRLIKIFAEINNKEWKLIIVGDEALKQNNRTELQSLIDNTDLTNNIRLEGNKTNVDEYYLRSKIFVFTSSSEGFPNVIGEAMSAGLPVVSYDCVAGPSEMIEDGKNGFLIPLFDDSMFKQKLNMLMNNENIIRDIGKKAKCSIKEFSKSRIAKKYYNFLLNYK